MTVSEQDIAALEQALLDLAKDHDLFVIAGSLPNGISSHKLASWISLLREKGKQVFFDSSNDALRAGLAAGPSLVKPNDEELSQWAGGHLSSEKELMDAGRALQATGIENIVISRGADGVLWLKEGEWLASQPPRMSVVSTVGAGDTLVAAMCWAEVNQWDREATLRFATALSALAVTQVNVGVEDIAQVDALQREITVTPINDNEGTGVER